MYMYDKTKNRENKAKHYPPANQEWYNSIYNYYKNNIKSLPITDKIVNKIIKSYFNLSPYINKTKSSRMSIRFKRLSTNRIFISKAIMKHTNNKVNIILYTYNRQIKYINRIKKLKKTLKEISLRKIRNKIIYKWFIVKYSVLNKIRVITIKLIKFNKSKSRYNFMKIRKRCDYLLRFKKAEKKRNYIIIDKTRKLENLNKYKRDMLKLNEKKFYYAHLYKLKNIIKKLYNKQVEFRIINLKKLHLNSDIFSESIAIKLKNRKNRLLRVLKKALNMVTLPYFNKYLFFNNKKYGRVLSMDNTFIRKYFNKLSQNKDILHEFFYKIFSEKKKSYCSLMTINNIEKNVFNSLKHKKINGIRLEASGRLTKRLTASRSIFKFKYKGNIKNMDSSYKKLSTVILKGHLKSNIQYTVINSKTRNGSFGLKGWVSSY